MILLPSERKARVEKTIEELKKLLDGERIAIYEPCDCGSHIRHNNGGNYHDEVYIARDEGKLFIKCDTTCELVEPAEWSESTEEDAIKKIEECGDWL
jgi:hypothetical protein